MWPEFVGSSKHIGAEDHHGNHHLLVTILLAEAIDSYRCVETEYSHVLLCEL